MKKNIILSSSLIIILVVGIVVCYLIGKNVQLSESNDSQNTNTNPTETVDFPNNLKPILNIFLKDDLDANGQKEVSSIDVICHNKDNTKYLLGIPLKENKPLVSIKKLDNTNVFYIYSYTIAALNEPIHNNYLEFCK